VGADDVCLVEQAAYLAAAGIHRKDLPVGGGHEERLLHHGQPAGDGIIHELDRLAQAQAGIGHAAELADGDEITNFPVAHCGLPHTAFLWTSPMKGVAAMIEMSKRIDQFSM